MSGAKQILICTLFLKSVFVSELKKKPTIKVMKEQQQNGKNSMIMRCLENMERKKNKIFVCEICAKNW